jgi:hypothetical protein
VVSLEGEPLPGEQQCIPVPAKKPTTIIIEATPSGRASGTVTGTLEVFEKVKGVEQGTTTQIPFRFDMARGVDEAQRLFLAVVLLLAGLGLPLAVLLIINAIAARFQVLDAVRGAVIPVRAKGSSVQRTDGPYPRPLVLRPDDFASLASAGNDRRFTFGGVVFHARASRNPFGATVALAAPEGGAEKLKGGEGSRVELDPSLAGSWIFLLDAERTRAGSKDEVDGLLIAFVAEGDFSTQTNRMLPDIARRLPSTASLLAGLVRGTRKKAPTKRQQKAAAAKAKASTTPADVEVEVDDALAAGADDAAAGPVEEVSPPDDPEIAPDEDGADGSPEEPEAPRAPAGFGGAARGGASPIAPPPSEEGPDDDGPGGPPLGFSGSRPDR